MIQVHINRTFTANDGLREAEGFAERFGTEVRWTAWSHSGDPRWSVRIAPGQDRDLVMIVGQDDVLEAVAAMLREANTLEARGRRSAPRDGRA
jgi:hypothetical protein